MRASDRATMPDRETIVRYLLGLMPEEERPQLQDRLFSDEDFFEAVMEVETDLIDAYSRGELTPAERKQMEDSLLRSAAARKRVEFAAALAGVAAAGARLPKPNVKAASRRILWLSVAASVILTAISTTLFLQNGELRGRIAVLQNERTATPPAQVSQPAPIFSVLLIPGALRGAGGVREIAIPASARVVELQLDLNGDAHDRYAARLSAAGGKKVLEVLDLSARRSGQGAYLSLVAPAGSLRPGPYELTVSAGGQPVEYYYFKTSMELPGNF